MVRVVVTNAQPGAQDLVRWSERSNHSAWPEMHTFKALWSSTYCNRKRSKT